MTRQFPNLLVNKCAGVDFGELQLSTVVVGDRGVVNGWCRLYPFINRPSVRERSKCSALIAGYIAEFEIAEDGTITLISYCYPFADDQPDEKLNERLTGDFWLIMTSYYEGRVYVPFEGGIIVTDESRWLTSDDEKLEDLKHPVLPRHFEPRNIPLAQAVFVGIISKIEFKWQSTTNAWIEVDRDVPRENHWCALQVVRDGRPIVLSRIGGSSGGDSGPWMLVGSFEPMIEVGDELYATERQPTEAEIEQQMLQG